MFKVTRERDLFFIKIVLLFVLFISFFLNPLYSTDSKAYLVSIDDYLKVFDRYSKSVCSKGSEENFWKLHKEFRKSGMYIPLVYASSTKVITKKNREEILDVKTIKQNLPRLKLKKSWLVQQKILLKKSNFKIINQDINKLLVLISKNLYTKEQYFDNKNQANLKHMLESYRELTNSGLSFLKDLTYFQTYDFPVNHLALRLKMERIKHRKDIRQTVNNISFWRKIVEDGANNKDGGTDLYLRAAINTLYLSLQDKTDYLSENVRSDFDYVLRTLQTKINKGLKYNLAMFDEWILRTDRTINFYEKLLGDQAFQKKTLEEGAHSLFELKSFVINKQIEAYLFWKKESELHQELFVDETILTNEVGPFDQENFEKNDILQVVLNRSFEDEYIHLLKNSTFFKTISSKYPQEKLNAIWPNILLSEGEFSFTYYYFPQTVRLFCPDMSRNGKKLRLKNLNVAKKFIEKKQQFLSDNNLKNILVSGDSEFELVTRYYSRASMLGRVRMEEVWRKFKPLGLRIGPIIENEREKNKLIEQYKKKNYQYLYHFTTQSGKIYKVIRIFNTTYVICDCHKVELMRYRDPHLFRYFKRII